MPFECNTSDNKLWESQVPDGTVEGTIQIDPEDPKTGDFTGVFTDVHDNKIRIKGRCLADVMWFQRPETDPEYFYWGTKFILPDDPDKKLVIGSRLSLKDSGINRASRRPLLLPDEWIAEKGV